MSVIVFSEVQNFRPAKVYLPKVKLLYSDLVDSINLRYNECDMICLRCFLLGMV
jgi:hypothetical protein